MNRVAKCVALVLAIASTGCFFDGLLDVTSPDRVAADVIEDPRYAELLVTSAIADFDCAFVNYIVAGGLLGDELADGQLDERQWDYDRRSINPSGTPVYAVGTCDGTLGPGLYQPLQTARATADHAIRLLQSPKFVSANIPNRTTLLATAAAYSGYSRLLLGEIMCFAAIDGGPELRSQEILELADQKLTFAIDTGLAAGATDIVNMARVGRARARVDVGRGVDAVADAQLVPPGFQKEAHYSAETFRSSNRIWTMNNRGERVTIEDDFQNVTHMGASDPRVPVQNTGRRTASGIPLWTQTKYRLQGSPIPIARYAEAQLIIAEVVGGATAVTIINSLHAAARLPAFSASSPDSILRHVIQERRLELFLESHHFFDKLRFNAMLEPDPLPDTPPAGAPYLTSGRPYGATKCLPLPDVERLNNPNIP